MANWLFKIEPGCFSYSDLEAAGSTVWDGVSNALARIHLRAAKPGDRVFLYHTGAEKAIVGVMEVSSEPRATDDDPKAVVLDVKPVKRLKTPVTLAVIKADAAFADWELVRMSRLSVMPVPPAIWKKIESLGR
jgi:predicted RNA-binding protein with PUA-like domain